jgi:hypothetical protein
VPNSNTWVSGDAFCLVRVGNTLAYPVTTSYGWSADGTSYPTQCTKNAASVAGSAAKYYCNKFNINVGLIYYPVENQDTTYDWTYHPTVAPTANPSPGPGKPTNHPTTRPTVRPSRLPSANPTPGPGKPTNHPTAHPSARPSRSPTPEPTTEAPTAEPTAEATLPTAEANILGGRRLQRKAQQPRERAGKRALDVEDPDNPVDPDDPIDDPDGGGGGGYYYQATGGDDEGGGAADDTYATEGPGTYASPYYANSATDDFTPLIPVLADNGLIYRFGKVWYHTTGSFTIACRNLMRSLWFR